MAHVREHEPAHLTAIAASVQQSVESHYVADQLVLDKIAAAADLLTAPTGFEGFEPIQRRRLSKLGRELDETVRWLADQRNLDLGVSSDVRCADFGESVTKTGKIAASAIQSASRAIGRGFDRARRDSADETTSE